MSFLHFLIIATSPIWALALLLILWCVTTAILGAIVWLYVRSGK